MRARRTASFAAIDLNTLEDRSVPAIAFENLPLVPDWDPEVAANLRQIADHGRALGRNPNAFMKLGDSNTADPGYLTQFGMPGYYPTVTGLASLYPNLLDTWQRYLAPIPGGNSYTRTSSAASGGWSMLNVLPTTPLELAQTNASVAIVMVGSNDQVLFSTSVYETNLRSLIDNLTAAGVVPIISSIPDIAAFWNRSGVIRAFNQVIADVAEEKRVPFINAFQAQEALPVLGLKGDFIHLSTSPRGGGWVYPIDVQFGQNNRNLLMLQALDWVQDNVFAPPRTLPIPETTAWTPLVAGQRVVAVGAGPGSPPVVRLSDPDSGKELTQFLAFDGSFTGGVQVAVGDINGDGVPDVIAAAGAGGGPAVVAFSGTDGHELVRFFAYEAGFTGGVSVAVGDVDSDGQADIVTGAGAGGGPRVRVVRASDLAPLADFMAFDPSFVGGVSVAVGNFGANIGQAIAVGPGVGGGGVVAYFDASGRQLAGQLIFDSNYRGGISLAAGDLNDDGVADLVVGALSGSTRVVALDTVGNQLASFFVEGRDRNGVRVAAVATSAGRASRIVTAASNPKGAVTLFDAGGANAGLLAGTAEPYFQAGPFVGG